MAQFALDGHSSVSTAITNGGKEDSLREGRKKRVGNLHMMPFVPHVSLFAFSTENVNAALSRLQFVMRNNPISHYWLTRLLYRVQYCAIRTIPMNNVALFDIYFISSFFSTRQVKLVFVPISSLFTFRTPHPSHVT